jgi:hypothetical protein
VTAVILSACESRQREAAFGGNESGTAECLQNALSLLKETRRFFVFFRENKRNHQK